MKFPAPVDGYFVEESQIRRRLSGHKMNLGPGGFPSSVAPAEKMKEVRAQQSGPHLKTGRPFMDKWHTGENLETGILGQIAQGLGTPAKEMMIGIVLPESHPDGFTRHHQNEQASRA